MNHSLSLTRTSVTCPFFLHRALKVVCFFLAFSSVRVSAAQTAGDVLINEVVTDPQQDWATNSFDGTTTVNAGGNTDEWIELYIAQSGLDLTDWTITAADGSSFTGDLTARDETGAGALRTSIYLGAGSFENTVAGDYLILGNPQSDQQMSNTVTITLENPSSEIIDQVVISSSVGTGFNGNADSPDDESVCRIPSGQDTDIDANDFVQTRATLGSSNSPLGTVLINEVVASPQQDWSTNAFSGTVGGGAITETDEWVELLVQTSGLNLAKWNIAVVDGSDFSGDLTSSGAFQTVNYVGTGSFNNTIAGDFIILGNPDGGSAINNNVYIELTDAYGNIVDDLELGDQSISGAGAPNGSSAGITDESVYRIPFAEDTDVDADDFQKGITSLAMENGVIYVSNSGNDTNLGTADSPLETIQAGINAAPDRGTVDVAAGTYNETITITSPLTLRGANAGTAGSVSRVTETVIEPLSSPGAIHIDSDSVTIDGLQVGVSNVNVGIYATGYSNIFIQNNMINADSVGVALVAATDNAIQISSNQVNISQFLTTGDPTATTGILLASLNGDADVDLSDNNYSGGANAIFVFDCQSTNILSIENDTIINATHGLGVYNTNGVTLGPSQIQVSGLSVSSFDELPIVDFPEAGIYFFSTGASSDADSINVTITNSTVSGVGNFSTDYAGMYLGDFSSADFSTPLQNITLVNSAINDNLNRGIYARGINAFLNVSQSTLSGNGFDPNGMGYSIHARNQAVVEVMQSVITNAASQTNSSTSGLHIGADPTFNDGEIIVSNSSLDNNGNGSIASNDGIDLSGNYFSTTDEATILSLVGANNDFTPWLASGIDTDPGTAGFQADVGNLIVGTAGFQTLGARTQEAHDLVTAGGTITLLNAAYQDTLLISREISIDPAAGASITNLTMDGGLLNIQDDLTVDSLAFNSGILDLDFDDGDRSDDPVLTILSTVGGTFGDGAFVEGKLSHEMAAAESFFFPVGDEGAYRPVSLQPTSVATFEVSYREEATPGAMNDDLVGLAAGELGGATIETVLDSRYWQIDVTANSPGNTDVILQLTTDDGVSNPGTLGMTRYDGGGWVEMTRIGGSSLGPNTYTLTARTSSFSPISVYSTNSTENPLPVELIFFNGERVGRNINLTWATASEVNSDFFEVQHSLDGLAFEAIGSVRSNGNTNQRKDYRFTDQSVADRPHFYRLKMVDFDGTYEFSPITQVTPDFSELKLEVYPNPTTSSVHIRGVGQQYINDIELFSLDGAMQKVDGSWNDSVFSLGELPDGYYLIRILLSDGNAFEGKLLKK